MKYVIASSNRQGDYDFLGPIWALVWRNVTDFTPVLLLTETREHWDTPCGRIVLDMLKQYEVATHYVGTIKEPYRTSVQAQASRQHAAIMPRFQPDDYLMMSDVDMLALSPGFYNRVDWGKAVHLRYSNAWHYSHFTTPYVGARAKVWREIMGYEIGPEIAPVLEAALEKHLTPERDTWQEHWFDEHYFTSKLKASRFYPGDCEFIERDGHPPKDRIDRGWWPENIPDLSNMTDAHVLRPAHSAENWPRILKLLEKLIPGHVSEMSKYRDRYYEAKR